MGQGRDLRDDRASGPDDGAVPYGPGNPASARGSRFVAQVPFPIGSSVDFIRRDGTRATGTVQVRRITESVALLTLRLADGALVEVAAWGNSITEFSRAGDHLLASQPRIAAEARA